MLIDGLTLLGNSTASNFTVSSGADLPVVGNSTGELFYKTGAGAGLYIYDGADWQLTSTNTVLSSHVADASLHITPGQNTLLDGITVSASEVNQLAGVTGSIQGQINANLSSITSLSGSLNTHAADQTLHLTSAQNTLLDSLVVGATQINYLANATSNIQDQLDSKAVASTTTAALAGKLDLAGGTMTGFLTLSGSPTNSMHAVTKQYVDDLSAGVNVHASVETATTTALASCTYNNGTGGVGATLTATANGVLGTVGGYAGLTVGSRVLIKNQTNAFQNGIYTVTSLGSASTPWILTRATDFDGSPTTEIEAGDLTYVREGTLAGSQWVQTNVGTGVGAGYEYVIVGTDNVVFTQFAGSGTYTAGTNIDLTNNVISVTGTVADATTATRLAGGSAGAVPYQSGVGTTSFTGVGSAGQVLTSNGTGAPTWSTPASTAPGGASGFLQYNNAGAFGGVLMNYSVTGANPTFTLFSQNAVTPAATLTTNNYNNTDGTSLTISTANGVFDGSAHNGGDLSIISGVGAGGGSMRPGNMVLQTGNFTGNGNGGDISLKSSRYVNVSAWGDMTFYYGTTERMRILTTGGLAFGGAGNYGTAGQVLTSNGTAAPTWSAAPSSSAGTLTGTTLAANVVSSSLTSLGTLTSLNVSGNITLTSTSQRILGDFANATVSNRPMFQSSVANANTLIHAIPNGTGTVSGFIAHSGSDPANSSALIVRANGTTAVEIISSIYGTGTYLPLTFTVNTAERFRIGTAGELGIGGANYGTAGQFLISNGTGNAAAWSSSLASGTTAITQAADTANTTVATTAFVDRLRGMPISTTSGTAVVGDRGKVVTVTAAFTVPASVFAAGDTFTIYNNSGSAVTITQGAGLTLRYAGTTNTGNRTLATYGFASVWFLSATEAVISGNIS